MHPEWSPIGADRFIKAIADGVYDGTCIYRVVRDQAVQFGYPKDPDLRKKWWHKGNLKDDPQIFQNPNFRRGMIAYAGGGPNTRGLDLFITFMTGNANGTPRAPWETPFGIIDESGMKHVTAFNPEYGDMKSFGGNGPDMSRGYEALKSSHPNIDYLGKCRLVYPEEADSQKGANEEYHHGGAPKHSHHDEQPSAEQAEEHRVYEPDYRPNGRPHFLNAQRPKRSELAGVRTVVVVNVGGSNIEVPVWTIAMLMTLLICVRLALPKFSKMLVRKITRCDF